jgi:AhpD family alkylhydroperoxidase
MTTLTLRERELVALGAALASNCVPCIEFHVPAARKAGLSDAEIGEAIALADKIRQVPAAKVLDAATAQLASAGAPATATSACCPPPAAGAKSSCC